MAHNVSPIIYPHVAAADKGNSHKAKVKKNPGPKVSCFNKSKASPVVSFNWRPEHNKTFQLLLPNEVYPDIGDEEQDHYQERPDSAASIRRGRCITHLGHNVRLRSKSATPARGYPKHPLHPQWEQIYIPPGDAVMKKKSTSAIFMNDDRLKASGKFGQPDIYSPGPVYNPNYTAVKPRPMSANLKCGGKREIFSAKNKKDTSNAGQETTIPSSFNVKGAPMSTEPRFMSPWNQISVLPHQLCEPCPGYYDVKVNSTRARPFSVSFGSKKEEINYTLLSAGASVISLFTLDVPMPIRALKFEECFITENLENRVVLGRASDMRYNLWKSLSRGDGYEAVKIRLISYFQYHGGMMQALARVKGVTKRAKIPYGWTSSLHSNGALVFELHHSKFEDIMCLMTYAIITFNEAKNHIKTPQVVDYLRQAAFIVQKVVEEIVFLKNRIWGALARQRPPEAITHFATALEKFFFAEAQRVMASQILQNDPNEAKLQRTVKLLMGASILYKSAHETFLGDDEFSANMITDRVKTYANWRAKLCSANAFQVMGELAMNDRPDQSIKWSKTALKMLKGIKEKLYKLKNAGGVLSANFLQDTMIIIRDADHGILVEQKRLKRYQLMTSNDQCGDNLLDLLPQPEFISRTAAGIKIPAFTDVKFYQHAAAFTGETFLSTSVENEETTTTVGG